MIDCTAIKIKEDAVSLNPRLLGADPMEVQITQLLNSIQGMIQEEGRLVYPDTMERLEELYPGIDIRQVEPTLRSRLWLNATRTVEYIDGIR